MWVFVLLLSIVSGLTPTDRAVITKLVSGIITGRIDSSEPEMIRACVSDFTAAEFLSLDKVYRDEMGNMSGDYVALLDELALPHITPYVAGNDVEARVALFREPMRAQLLEICELVHADKSRIATVIKESSSSHELAHAIRQVGSATFTRELLRFVLFHPVLVALKRETLGPFQRIAAERITMDVSIPQVDAGIHEAMMDQFNAETIIARQLGPLQVEQTTLQNLVQAIQTAMS